MAWVETMLEFGSPVPPPPGSQAEILFRLVSKLRHLSPILNRQYYLAGYPELNHPVPMNIAWITQHFGQNPASYKPLLGHDGIDYGCNVGTPVMCPVDQMTIIDLILQTNSYGRHAWGQDGQGHKYIFGHLHEFCVSKGDVITRGQIFATTGGNLDDPYHGYSTGPHLHFEWRPVWASISNGYAGAENQEPYITVSGIEPVVIPDPEPDFYLIVNTDQLQERTSPKIPYLNNNRTGRKFPKGTKLPVHGQSLEGRLWAKISKKADRFACIQENDTHHMG